MIQIERRLNRYLTSELGRQRLERTKRLVYETVRRIGGDEMADRVIARWLRFLCSHPFAQRALWPEATDFLRQFATVFGLSLADTREFVGLSLMGRQWRAWRRLLKTPPELVARLTRVVGWEHFDRCLQDGAGIILLPFHGQFARRSVAYLRHRGHEGLTVGLPDHKLEEKGLRTPTAKRFELARQMHAAKHLLSRGGIVFNVPDARQNLDNSRPVEFFGRQRRIATGFAELALMTGAHVMPIAYRFSPRGFCVLEFAAPFHVLGPQSSHEERIDSLVEQYASFLRAEWRRSPWDIHWHHLEYYCLLPEVDLGALGAKADARRLPETRPANA